MHPALGVTTAIALTVAETHASKLRMVPAAPPPILVEAEHRLTKATAMELHSGRAPVKVSQASIAQHVTPAIAAMAGTAALARQLSTVLAEVVNGNAMQVRP